MSKYQPYKNRLKCLINCTKWFNISKTTSNADNSTKIEHMIIKNIQVIDPNDNNEHQLVDF